jgi:hypothetical protein
VFVNRSHIAHPMFSFDSPFVDKKRCITSTCLGKH